MIKFEILKRKDLFRDNGEKRSIFTTARKLYYLKVLCVFFIFCIPIKLKSQWVESRALNFRNHGDKYYINEKMETIFCGLFDSTETGLKYYYYINEKWTDMVYFQLINKSKKIQTTGFYKLNYQLKSLGNYNKLKDFEICWLPELVWTYFDENEKILKIEYYDNGIIKNPFSTENK